MRVLISADMEGIGGVAGFDDPTIGKPDYERFRRFMTAEVNAVINGVLETEPGANVRVADAHGQFRNILPEELDPRVTLIRGRPRVLGMMEGVQDGVDAVMFVGYHAKSGSLGVISHTMNGANLDVRVNGRSLGEIGVNALLAGRTGAPVVFCSGDDAACAEFADVVPGAVTVEVKRAIGQSSAETIHPKVIHSRLREGAARAIAKRGQIAPLAVDGSVELEMDVHRPYIVDLAVMIPGVSRVGGRTVRFETDSYEEAYRVMMLVTTLASVPVTV